MAVVHTPQHRTQDWQTWCLGPAWKENTTMAGKLAYTGGYLSGNCRQGLAHNGRQAKTAVGACLSCHATGVWIFKFVEIGSI